MFVHVPASLFDEVAPSPPPGGSPPVASDDNLEAVVNVDARFLVLANDSDPAGLPLRVVGVTQPTGGGGGGGGGPLAVPVLDDDTPPITDATGSDTSHNVDSPDSPTADELILVLAGSSDDYDTSPISHSFDSGLAVISDGGMSLDAGHSSLSHRISGWSKTAGSEPASYALTLDEAAAVVLASLHITGVEPDGGVVKISVAEGTSTEPQSPSAVVANDKSLILQGFAATTNTVGTIDANYPGELTGIFKRFSNNGEAGNLIALAIGRRDQETAGTTPAVTWSGAAGLGASRPWTGFTIVIEATGDGQPAPAGTVTFVEFGDSVDTTGEGDLFKAAHIQGNEVCVMNCDGLGLDPAMGDSMARPPGQTAAEHHRPYKLNITDFSIGAPGSFEYSVGGNYAYNNFPPSKRPDGRNVAAAYVNGMYCNGSQLVVAYAFTQFGQAFTYWGGGGFALKTDYSSSTDWLLRDRNLAAVDWFAEPLPGDLLTFQSIGTRDAFTHCSFAKMGPGNSWAAELGSEYDRYVFILSQNGLENDSGMAGQGAGGGGIQRQTMLARCDVGTSGGNLSRIFDRQNWQVFAGFAGDGVTPVWSSNFSDRVPIGKDVDYAAGYVLTGQGWLPSSFWSKRLQRWVHIAAAFQNSDAIGKSSAVHVHISGDLWSEWTQVHAVTDTNVQGKSDGKIYAPELVWEEDGGIVAGKPRVIIKGWHSSLGDVIGTGWSADTKEDYGLNPFELVFELTLSSDPDDDPVLSVASDGLAVELVAFGQTYGPRTVQVTIANSDGLTDESDQTFSVVPASGPGGDPFADDATYWSDGTGWVS